MAQTITAAVGRMGALNRPDDVKTVQKLLNQVPATSGGPKPLLDPDGICGPKTIAAIQTFQVRHFGWPGADGRVDPNGPTLAKLNQFDGSSPPVTQQVRTLSIRRVGPSGIFVDPNRPEEWFFSVGDPTRPGISAVYHFGQRNEHKTLLTPIAFQGGSQIFQTDRSLLDLESQSASYLTDYGFPPSGPDPKFARSRFTLLYLQDSGAIDRVRIAAVDHLQPPPPSNFPGLGDLTPSNVRAKSGVFQFVK
jgi:hypothetical protein